MRENLTRTRLCRMCGNKPYVCVKLFSYAVVVDALDQQAKSFYLKYGFKELADDYLHLYLPMRTINKLNL